MKHFKTRKITKKTIIILENYKKSIIILENYKKTIIILENYKKNDYYSGKLQKKRLLF